MTEQKTDIESLKKMREPFPGNQVSLLPKPTKKDNQKGRCQECGGYHGLPAVHIKYVGHAALTDRLLDVDPLWNWEPVSVDENGFPVVDDFGGMWIRLTICGVTRLGYGDSGGKKGADANKERIGDALRNAAMRFGAALDLWHKGDLHISTKKDVSLDDKLSQAIDWVNSFVERKTSVEYFDQKISESKPKFNTFPEDMRHTIDVQISDVREYLIELELVESEEIPENKSKLKMEI